MKTRTAIVSLAVLAALLLGGCTTNVNTVSRAEQAGSPNVIQDKRIVTDSSLAGKVSILRVAEDVASGDLSKIQVTLVNNRNRSLTVNYVFEWFDLNGMQINTASATWKPLRFMGREEKSIQAIAPSPRAVDFVLKLQEAN